MRYSLPELIARANSGKIGRRGLRRLEGAGLNPSELGQSGVASPLNVDPNADLAARRTALYGHALEAAHNLQPGQALSAGLQRRLALGSGDHHSFDPQNVQGAQAFQGDSYTSLLGALKKRSKGIASSAGIYRGF